MHFDLKVVNLISMLSSHKFVATYRIKKVVQACPRAARMFKRVGLHDADAHRAVSCEAYRAKRERCVLRRRLNCTRGDRC